MTDRRIRASGSAPSDASLVPVERDPITGRTTGLDRDRKSGRQEHRPSDPPASPVPPSGPQHARPGGRAPGRRGIWLAAGAAAVTAAIIIGIVVIGAQRTDPTGQAGPLPTGISAGAEAASGTQPTAGPGGTPTGPGGGSGPATTVSGPTSGDAAVSGTGGQPANPTSGTSSSEPTSAIPPFLDPRRVAGYRSVVTMTRSEHNGRPYDDQGKVSRGFWLCSAEGCSFGRLLNGKHPVGTPSIAEKHSEATDCAGVPFTLTTTLTMTLDPATGNYHGTELQKPSKASMEYGNGSTCEPQLLQFDIELTPVVGPDLSAIPDGTPPALNPAKITKYAGSVVADGKTAATTASCHAGVCSFRCSICGGQLPFEAAAPSVSETIDVGSQCGTGKATINLARDATGGYQGTVTAKYKPAASGSGAQGPACATKLTYTLKPQTG